MLQSYLYMLDLSVHSPGFIRTNLNRIKNFYSTGMLDMNKYLLLFVILLSTNALAAISKWVDSNGQVHYSDQPPPLDVRPKTLRPDADTQDTASSGVAAPQTIAEREAELKKSQKAKK